MAKDARGGQPTPVMRQWDAAKEAHPDALLFFRMGDFYELFGDDAVVAARALDLTLTSRNKGAEDELPMAGVPHLAASQYLQRLLDQGFKVAICEQMADPSKVKGLVPREVVRVVSPGIVYDDAGLRAAENHFVVALEAGENGPFGVAFLDASTGELGACEAESAQLAVAECVRLDPRELLAGPATEGVVRVLCNNRARLAVRVESEPIDDVAATARLDALLGASEAVAACASPLARRAAARCIAFAQACEPGKSLPVSRLSGYVLSDTLVLDEATQAHLELVRTLSGDTKGALLGELDATVTAAGARLLRRRLLAPRMNVAELRRRLDAVELFVMQPGVRRELRERLGAAADLERIAVKLAVDRAGPRDLLALSRTLASLPELASVLECCPDRSAREALGVADGAPWVEPASDLAVLLERALEGDPPARASDGNVLREGYDAELDEYRTLQRDGQRLIVELEARLREQSQIGSLKLRYTRVFGWYVEVTRAHLEKVPSSFRRKQTIANGERYSCDELDDLADRLAHAEERFRAREASLYAALVRELSAHVERLRAIAATLAQWDVASALAEVAHRRDYARPHVDESLRLLIEEGRHPVVEQRAAAGRFVPNDVDVDANPGVAESGGAKRLWLVTGPNMAGKSTFMRQAALIVILAQMGSFVPARKAHIGVVDRVLTRVGASDNLARGESTFMVEMTETANILRRATRRSLVVLDEIGRGTSTYDGLAIAWAVAEYLHDAIGCRALFATHYHELTELAATRAGCDNFSVSAREHDGEILFLHRLAHGVASRSYGVACARLAGVPEVVLLRARAILAELERGAALPSGAHASMRARTRAGKVQLDLFASNTDVDERPNPAVELLKAVDIDRLTPLEALQLVAQLKAMATAK